MADIPPTGPVSWSDFRKVSGRQGNAISASDLNMSGPNQPFKNSIVVASKMRGTPPKLPMRFSKQVTNSILGLYSMKLANPEYTGPVVQIKRSSDNALLDFYADMNGTLVSATGVTYTTWISESSDGSVMIWYDQSGAARHAVPSLSAYPPQLVTDPAGSGKYVIYFPNLDATVSILYGFQITAQAVSATMIQYYSLSKANTFQYIISQSTDLSLRFNSNLLSIGTNGDFLNPSGGFAAFDGTYNASSPYITNTDNTWHSICVSKTSDSLNIERIGTAGSTRYARSFYGYMSEVITFSAPLQAVNSTVPEYDVFYKNTHIPSWSRGLIANYSPENWNGTSSWLDNYSTNHGTQSGGTVNLTSTANMENLFTSLTSGAQTSARGIYSCRRINTNYTGPTFKIRRSSDNVFQDFYTNGNGDLGTTVGARGQSIAEWLGASTAYVATWYDQSGLTQEYPPAALTDSATTLTGLSYMNGTYIVTASSIFTNISGRESYKAFNKSAASLWSSLNGTYQNYNYIGTASTAGISGEWLQIQLPIPIILTKYNITARSDDPTSESPSSFTLFGSSDGSAWVAIDARTGIAWTSQTLSYTFTISAPSTAYAYYRLVTSVINGTNDKVSIGDLYLYTYYGATTQRNLDYPPAAFGVINYISFSGLSYGNGTYVTNRSSAFNSGRDVRQAFNRTDASYWSSANFYSSGGYIGGQTTEGVPGEWIQIQLPTSIVLGKYTIRRIANKTISYLLETPATFTLFGSSNGTTWVALDTQSGIVWEIEILSLDFVINSPTTAYAYYRLVITAINSTNLKISINELILYTHDNYASQPVLDTGAKRVDFGGQTNAFLSLPNGTVPLQTPYTAIVRHGNMSQADGGFFFAGQAATNLGHGMRKSNTGYIDYWNNNDISTGTNTFRTENIVLAGSTTFVNGEFPPVALGDYTRTLSDLPYGNGPYVIRASSSVNFQSSGARNAFDKGGGAWIGGTYTDDVYAGLAETVANGITYRGEWIELQLPYAISLKYYIIFTSSNSSWTSRMIKDWVLLGSNDGSTWNVVDTQTGITNWPGSLTFVTNSVTAYSYYRVSIQKGRASTGTNNISIGELYFYGDGVESAVYVNGTLTTVNTRTGLAAIQVAGSEVLGKSAGSEFLNGTMYDCWLFNSYLSGNDKIIIENTLMNCSTTAPSLWGNAGTNINFPAGILPATYTLFHNTRYNRNALGERIWTVQYADWVSGHHRGKSGVAWHGTDWITPIVNRHDVNWITCADQQNVFRSLGKNRETVSGASGVNNLYIGSYAYGEASNWASTGAIVFNRELNASEIKHVEDFIASKYKTPIPPQEGLALSLDASDFLTSDSTTTWYDRSGGARNFTLSNASAYKAYSPTDNNTFQFPYMDFTQYGSTATSGTDVSWSADTNTFIWFGTIKNSTAAYRTFMRGVSNDHHMLVFTGENRIGVYNNTTGTGYVSLDQAVDVSYLDKVYTRFNMHVWKMSSVSPYVRYYFNPSLAPCMPKGISTNANSWIPHGFYSLGSYLGSQYAGYCGTALTYNRDVSDEELVEIYKRHMVKYELPAPMPSLNPIGNGYIFTKNTTFIVPAGVTSIKVLAIAGGGGGGGGYEGGGGGAGGLIYNTAYAVTPGESITVTIGLGGYGARLGSLPQSGQNTVFGTLTAYGGGSGGTEQYPNQNPANGGSGGGAGHGSGFNVAATGVYGQGFNGGVTLANPDYSNGFSAGGGGGADGVGGNTTTTRGGNGGPGREITILGITKYYAGGGAGARRGNSGGFDGQGGIGGGGSASCFGGAAPDKGGDAKFYGSGGGGGAMNYPGTAYGGDGFQGLVMVDWT